MEPNPQVTPTLRYAAVVVPNFDGGEKRLVSAALMETCTCITKTRQNSPYGDVYMYDQNQTKLPEGSNAVSEARRLHFFYDESPRGVGCESLHKRGQYRRPQAQHFYFDVRRPTSPRRRVRESLATREGGNQYRKPQHFYFLPRYNAVVGVLSQWYDIERGPRSAGGKSASRSLDLRSGPRKKSRKIAKSRTRIRVYIPSN